jgi:hypothetical protein
MERVAGWEKAAFDRKKEKNHENMACLRIAGDFLGRYSAFARFGRRLDPGFREKRGDRQSV